MSAADAKDGKAKAQPATGKQYRIKIVTLMKRNPAITHEQFKDHYENVHVPLYRDYWMQHGCERYTRRYLTPISGMMTSPSVPSGYDVIMEGWFSDKQFCEDFLAGKNADQAFKDHIKLDEDIFLNHAESSVNVVEEFEVKDGVFHPQSEDYQDIRERFAMK